VRRALRWTGNLCIVASVLGLAGLAYVVLGPETSPPWIAETPFEVPRPGASQAESPLPRGEAAPPGALAALPMAGYRAITHLEVERIGLSADVVPAQLVERNGATTWEVPAFKVGHAEATAGAGAPGNAVLLGHVTSVRSGNVFRDLEQMQVGDAVQIYSESDHFDYRVVDVERVQRTDAQVLEQGLTPTVSLITCTGIWLPTIWDYTERLVVRAELAERR
jgi:LPXTG-site transpeptidase (sortase) family protein